jgi:putative membrane protein
MPTFHVTWELNNYFLSGGFRAAVIRVLITGIAVFLAVMIVLSLEVDSLRAGLAVVLVLTIVMRTAYDVQHSCNGQTKTIH